MVGGDRKTQHEFNSVLVSVLEMHFIPQQCSANLGADPA